VDALLLDVRFSGQSGHALYTRSKLIGRPIVSIARSVPGFFGFTSNAPFAKKKVRPNVATAEILEA